LIKGIGLNNFLECLIAFVIMHLLNVAAGRNASFSEEYLRPNFAKIILNHETWCVS